MKNLFLITLLALSTLLAAPAWSDDSADLEQDTAVTDVEKPNWHSAIQTKYSYTDEQMKAYSDSGINYAQLAKASEMAKLSGKTTDEVLKMRQEQKMGWGKIAKELGVKPGELGKSVAALRHEVQEKRQEARTEKKEAREEKREAKMEKRAEHAKRRAERLEKKSKK